MSSVSSAGNVPFSGRSTPLNFTAGVRSEAPGVSHSTDLIGGSVESHAGVDRGAMLRLTAGPGVAEHCLESSCVGVGGGQVADWYARGEVSDGAMVPGEFRPATLSSLEECLAADGTQVRPGCIGVADSSALRSLCEQPAAGPYDLSNFGPSHISLDRDF